jgi:hypothetical protein
VTGDHRGPPTDSPAHHERLIHPGRSNDLAGEANGEHEGLELEYSVEQPQTAENYLQTTSGKESSDSVICVICRIGRTGFGKGVRSSAGIGEKNGRSDHHKKYGANRRGGWTTSQLATSTSRA